MVAVDLQLTRVRAISQNVRYQISFTPGSDQYIIERWNVGANSYGQEGIGRQLGNPENPYYKTGVDLTDPAGSIVFQTKGTASNSTIRLASNVCNKAKNITVSFAGMVRIE